LSDEAAAAADAARRGWRRPQAGAAAVGLKARLVLLATGLPAARRIEGDARAMLIGR